ncbi:MAG: helix-turn-helix domain-containing protein [Alistipes senegalensis]|nr:helix-turn-helix domain-containing protein [Alistipes senegalensis]
MNDIYTSNFKQHLRPYLLEMRGKLKITQSEMAELLHISPRAYANLETGKSYCNVITLIWLFGLNPNGCYEFIQSSHRELIGLDKHVLLNIPLSDIQETLVYRTPMKVTETRLLSNGDSFPMCPHCHSLLEWEYMNFCDCCGQALDWRGYRYSKIIK